jgi:hypothetical protein
MTVLDERRQKWRQTPDTAIPDWEAARPLIEVAHIVTHYPSSPEIANIFHASVGDPEAKTDAKWDSPSGRIYPWRWYLGRANSAFYTSLVRKRPTWISWDLLPALLRVRAELRTPDELADLGTLSEGAYRITQALEAAGGVLTTAELRDAAGYPTGKEHRAAYLKAIEELEGLLMLAKVFPDDGPADADRMSHALVSLHYRDACAEADRTAPDEAFARLIELYLETAVFLAPAPFARHLRLDEARLRLALNAGIDTGRLRTMLVEGYKGECFARV